MKRKPNGLAKIDKGVPLPKDTRGTHRWPWHLLKVGDSFFMPGKRAENSGAHTRGNRLGFKFACRTESKGVRIWRIK